MGLNEVLARLAVRAAHVLVVEVPGHWRTRVEVEQQLRHRGWRAAWTPAGADVLVVCGPPGPELAEVVARIWDQMPGPRARADASSPAAVQDALDGAEALLLDTAHHRRDARARPQEPGPEAVPRSHEDPDATGHGGHEDTHHGGTDHGDMDMAPAGVALAEGGEDRDGLGMDVLHVPLGPVLPHWPAGLVLHCSLQGDVVVEAEVEVLGHGTAEPAPAQEAAAVRCDNLAFLLALTGLEDAAARARTARDAALAGDRESAAALLGRLERTLARSRLLRWSLRGVLPLGAGDVARHGLPDRVLGDAYDRMLSLLDRAGAALDDEPAGDAGAVPVAALPGLVTGLDLAVLRLAVASLDLDPLPAGQEVTRA